jgi:hypothetical protein
MSVGSVIMGIGGLHTAFGLAAFGDVWAGFLKAGLINSVGGSHELSSDNLVKHASFWFTYSGLLMASTGLAIYHLEKQLEKSKEPLPVSISASLAVAGGACVTFIPQSGGWLFFVPAYMAYKKSIAKKGD